jgi:hypothetical protein
MVKKALLAIASCLALMCYSASSNAQFPTSGGSDYGWYFLNGCDREPYGVIYNYDTAQSTIDGQLQTMHANSQARLRIPIYHARGLNTGTIMDSTGGNLSPRFTANLTNFLASVRQQGFAEVEVGFFPQWVNDPSSWSAWNEDLYQENWNLIVNLRPIITGSGLAYRIDLLNEGIPTSGQAVLLQYTQRLWADYTFTYGKADTVGFSVISSDSNRLNQIPSVYGGNYPYLFDMHIYENSYAVFVNAHNVLAGLGLTQRWIIGEAFYDDAQEAQDLSSAIRDTGRTVFYLAQWPLSRNQNCSAVDVAPPSAFDQYSAHGF